MVGDFPPHNKNNYFIIQFIQFLRDAPLKNILFLQIFCLNWAVFALFLASPENAKHLLWGAQHILSGHNIDFGFQSIDFGLHNIDFRVQNIDFGL